MAKREGILVKEFGFGLPPRIWGKKIGETIYSVNLLPIGGFVQLYGENGDEEVEAEFGHQYLKGRALFEKSIPRRVGVLLAGVMMNFLLAVIVFSSIYFVTGIPTKSNQVKIISVAKDSPAAIAGLKAGDTVVSLDDKKLTDVDEFIELTRRKAGEVTYLEIKRAGQENPCLSKEVLGGKVEVEEQVEAGCRGENLLVVLVPRTQPPKGEGPLGVGISGIEMRHYPDWQMPFYGVREGFRESFAWSKMILRSLRGVAQELIFHRRVSEEVTGPIGIYVATGEVAKSGILALVEFLGILSVNLAVVNVLPFPPFDGGRLFFLGVEAVLGRRVAPKIEAWIINLGMVLALFLILIISINDLYRILSANHLVERLKTIF